MLDLRRYFPDVVSFFIPRYCLHCGAAAEDSGALCRNCALLVRRTGPGHEAWEHASAILVRSGVVSHLLPCFLFDRGGPLRDILHALKYGGAMSLGRRLGRELGREFATAGVPAVLVPVPLHPARRRERGFNQSDLIAAGISESSGLAVETSVVRRLRNTPSQTTLDAAGRVRNVQGAFAPGPAVGRIEGRTVLLVDDVVTTGSTLVECARILTAAGASAVVAAPLAVAEPEKEGK